MQNRDHISPPPNLIGSLHIFYCRLKGLVLIIFGFLLLSFFCSILFYSQFPCAPPIPSPFRPHITVSTFFIFFLLKEQKRKKQNLWFPLPPSLPTFCTLYTYMCTDRKKKKKAQAQAQAQDPKTKTKGTELHIYTQVSHVCKANAD